MSIVAKVWSGEGKPLASQLCNVLVDGDIEPTKVQVIAYHEDDVWLQTNMTKHNFIVRTEKLKFGSFYSEQELAIQTMSSLLNHCQDNYDCCKTLYDAGYRAW
jgi:hypothetical protein